MLLQNLLVVFLEDDQKLFDALLVLDLLDFLHVPSDLQQRRDL